MPERARGTVEQRTDKDALTADLRSLRDTLELVLHISALKAKLIMKLGMFQKLTRSQISHRKEIRIMSRYTLCISVNTPLRVNHCHRMCLKDCAVVARWWAHMEYFLKSLLFHSVLFSRPLFPVCMNVVAVFIKINEKEMKASHDDCVT